MNMMNTKIERVNPEQIDETIMEEAGRLIAEGELVAFPTETVYGLGGDALHPEAARKIYAAKGRPSDNPLIVHIADFSDMERVAREVPEAARKLAGAFWPGPLTMIVWKSDAVPMATTGGMDTVAVRMPNHPVALDLIRKSGCLIAAPSANTSGRPSPTEASHVAEDLSGRIAMILDGGPVGIGIESTIIDLTESKPMVLRPGYITPQMLSEVLGEEVIIDPGIIAALYEASASGVKIDLIVRGICCLRVGIPGVSENISVRSIVGNFLEHSRIFYFYNDGNPEVFMGSADWMPRNLDRRVEIVFPVIEEELKEKALHILHVELEDNVKARVMQPDGTYEKLDKRGKVLINSQEQFCQEAKDAVPKEQFAGSQRIFIPAEPAE